MNRLKWGGWIGLIIVLSALPSFSQEANFGTLTLEANQASVTLSGTTGGTTSLPAIVSNRDRHDNKCLGFGDTKPDHLLILRQGLPKLELRVNSGGSDTTLVVQGPNGIVRCGDDTRSSKDASIIDTDWQAGTYRIWIGSTTPGERRDYKLIVRR
jgi:hypothetical protein